MDQVIMVAIQACQVYAKKSKNATLTEYEMLMYEQLCQLVKTHSMYLALRYREQVPEAERDALKAEREHAEWLRAQDQEEDQK